MSCELYDNFIKYSLLAGVSDECVFEAGCPKAVEDCKVGKVLIDVDKESKMNAETPEDLEQDRVLAELEAKAKFNILNEALKRVN